MAKETKSFICSDSSRMKISYIVNGQNVILSSEAMEIICKKDKFQLFTS